MTLDENSARWEHLRDREQAERRGEPDREPPRERPSNIEGV